MEKLRKNKKIILKIFLLLPIIFIGLWRVFGLKQPIILSDEYGYWSNGAFFIGKDWSQITRNIGYYSYGYSVILAIIQLLKQFISFSSGQAYQMALFINIAMLVSGYLMADKICERFFKELEWPVSNILCMVIFMYTSNIFYAHMTLTETAILFCFWLFLYIMMKAVDNPKISNHIALAAVSVYIFTVHQRSVAIMITASIIVIMIKAAGISRMKDCISYFITFAVFIQLHTVIKAKLQNDSYVGLEPVSWKDSFIKSISVKTLILTAGIVLILLMLFLIEKKKEKAVCWAAVIGFFAIIAYVIFCGIPGMGQGAQKDLIAINDFEGQWGKIRNIFSAEGFTRLAVSIMGKWFYMASASGLVACWGIHELLVNGFKVIKSGIISFIKILKFKNPAEAIPVHKNETAENLSNRIWYFGVFLAFFGSFMISSIYKEGFYKNDDLINGRYNEFLMGILLIISFRALIKDKKWILKLVIFGIFYITSGSIIEYMFQGLERMEFELCHSVIFGRIIWNYQVPVGRIPVVFKYVLTLAAAFILIMKIEIPKLRKNARYIIALVIPFTVWTYLSFSLIEHYTMSVTGKYDRSSANIANWINLLDDKKDYSVYFLKDTESIVFAEMEQFLLMDRQLNMVNSDSKYMEEEAFFIANSEYAYVENFFENYYIVCDTGTMALLVGTENELGKRFRQYSCQGY